MVTLTPKYIVLGHTIIVVSGQQLDILIQFFSADLLLFHSHHNSALKGKYRTISIAVLHTFEIDFHFQIIVCFRDNISIPIISAHFLWVTSR